MSENNATNFDLWWNSPSVKRFAGAAYSLGASVVIIGAMFKILHLHFANYILGVGMTTEAILFGLGVFDKPFKEYDWHKVFDFEGNELGFNANGVASGTLNNVSGLKQNAGVNTNGAVGANLNITGSLTDDDIKSLSDGIKSISNTAKQLSGLTEISSSAEQLVQNLDSASEVTGAYIKNQNELSNSVSQLGQTYQDVISGMETAEKSTKMYAGKIDDMNKNLASINSIYEIQLKNIQVQTEALSAQAETVRLAGSELKDITVELQKMKNAAQTASEESENYKSGVSKLSKQIAELNQIYGNMLNSLN